MQSPGTHGVVPGVWRGAVQSPGTHGVVPGVWRGAMQSPRQVLTAWSPVFGGVRCSLRGRYSRRGPRCLAGCGVVSAAGTHGVVPGDWRSAVLSPGTHGVVPGVWRGAVQSPRQILTAWSPVFGGVRCSLRGRYSRRGPRVFGGVQCSLRVLTAWSPVFGGVQCSLRVLTAWSPVFGGVQCSLRGRYSRRGPRCLAGCDAVSATGTHGVVPGVWRGAVQSPRQVLTAWSPVFGGVQCSLRVLTAWSRCLAGCGVVSGYSRRGARCLAGCDAVSAAGTHGVVPGVWRGAVQSPGTHGVVPGVWRGAVQSPGTHGVVPGVWRGTVQSPGTHGVVPGVWRGAVQSPRQVHHHGHVAAGARGAVGLLPDPQHTGRPRPLDTLKVSVDPCERRRKQHQRAYFSPKHMLCS